jgi:hypothetical protein
MNLASVPFSDTCIANWMIWPQLIALWHYLRDWVLQPLFWMLLVLAAQKVWSWYTSRPLRQLWGGIIQSQERVPIVLGDVPAANFVIPDSGGKVAHLPPNAPFVGVGDAVGTALLQILVRDFHRNVAVEFSSESGPDTTQLNFVAVGGPSVNMVTRRVLVDENLDAGLRIVYPDHYAVDGANGQQFHAEFDQMGRITADYGFIVVGPNPFRKDKVACLVFGIWPPGTRAAVEELLSPEPSPLGKELVKRIKKHQGAVAVVKTSVTNLSQGGPRIIEVRPLLAR